MEHYCSGRMNFGILVSMLYDPLGSKLLSISLDVRSIVLQTAFLESWTCRFGRSYDTIV